LVRLRIRFPVRRLNLNVGESRSAGGVAQISSFQIEPLEQNIIRLYGNLSLKARAGGSSPTLKVNETRFVTGLPELWQIEGDD
jgi:hypothetical protein